MSGVLDKQTTTNTLEFKIVLCSSHGDRQQTQILLDREDFTCSIGKGRSNDNLGKLLNDFLSCSLINFTVKGNDATKSALGICLECLHVGLMRIHTDCRATGVGMLNDHTCRRFKATNSLPGGIAVTDVVVRKLLALQLRITGQKVPGQ